MVFFSFSLITFLNRSTVTLKTSTYSVDTIVNLSINNKRNRSESITNFKNCLLKIYPKLTVSRHGSAQKLYIKKIIYSRWLRSMQQTPLAMNASCKNKDDLVLYLSKRIDI